MRLSKLVIKGYRSIKGEEALVTDDRVTILIGANDHGKSNILAALQCLNDDSPLTPDDRHWDLPDKSEVEIRWYFKPSGEEIGKLMSFSPMLSPDASAAVEGDAVPKFGELFSPNLDNEIVFVRNLSTNKVKVHSTFLPILKAREDEILKLRPRVDAKKLQIHLLPENKSSEDAFCDLALLRAAARLAFQKLIDDGVRQPKEGLNIEEQLNEIVSSAGVTLGRTLDKVTKGWFEPGEKLSKLLIAVLYEDGAKANSQLPATAFEELKKIKALLDLRGEKSERKGVLEEVAN